MYKDLVEPEEQQGYNCPGLYVRMPQPAPVGSLRERAYRRTLPPFSFTGGAPTKTLMPDFPAPDTWTPSSTWVEVSFEGTYLASDGALISSGSSPGALQLLQLHPFRGRTGPYSLTSVPLYIAGPPGSRLVRGTYYLPNVELVPRLVRVRLRSGPCPDGTMCGWGNVEVGVKLVWRGPAPTLPSEPSAPAQPKLDQEPSVPPPPVSPGPETHNASIPPMQTPPAYPPGGPASLPSPPYPPPMSPSPPPPTAYQHTSRSTGPTPITLPPTFGNRTALLVNMRLPSGWRAEGGLVVVAYSGTFTPTANASAAYSPGPGVGPYGQFVIQERRNTDAKYYGLPIDSPNASLYLVNYPFAPGSNLTLWLRVYSSGWINLRASLDAAWRASSDTPAAAPDEVAPLPGGWTLPNMPNFPSVPAPPSPRPPSPPPSYPLQPAPNAPATPPVSMLLEAWLTTLDSPPTVPERPLQSTPLQPQQRPPRRPSRRSRLRPAGAPGRP
ncbi:hypothetical protein HYH03_015674 [Edaphochlamys debaryana]|uniref:Uncharacterized protein n=1 Tax=Edaphochlamys debaryana TaxID=47281 RepID=A0A835XKP7_9CHLO|nr:hypothetical protein HYH03_015674 [Edaphochlamys debaryana]|eukprot:KAG2485611.1 hypothetical protein HYH03_015674 [Edaphochlamys debaryana]